MSATFRALRRSVRPRTIPERRWMFSTQRISVDLPVAIQGFDIDEEFRIRLILSGKQRIGHAEKLFEGEGRLDHWRHQDAHAVPLGEPGVGHGLASADLHRKAQARGHGHLLGAEHFVQQDPLGLHRGLDLRDPVLLCATVSGHSTICFSIAFMVISFIECDFERGFSVRSLYVLRVRIHLRRPPALTISSSCLRQGEHCRDLDSPCEVAHTDRSCPRADPRFRS